MEVDGLTSLLATLRRSDPGTEAVMVHGNQRKCLGFNSQSTH
jgi:hypothetical protein